MPELKENLIGLEELEAKCPFCRANLFSMPKENGIVVWCGNRKCTCDGDGACGGGFGKNVKEALAAFEMKVGHK